MGLSSAGGAPDPCNITNVFGVVDPSIGQYVKMLTTTDGRVTVDPRLSGTGNAVIVLLGQSGAATCHLAPYTPVNTGAQVLDILTGRVSRALDPLPGDTNHPLYSPLLQGNIFTRVADTLITNGKFSRVIVLPGAVGGSGYYQWLSTGGYLYPRFAAMKARLDAHGYTPTMVLWVQGVSDATWGTSQADCIAQMQDMIETMRTRLGWTCPIFLSKESTNAPNPTGSALIRGAVDNIVAANVNVFLGPNQDALDATNRFDGCHWNTTGAPLAAANWIAPISAQF